MIGVLFARRSMAILPRVAEIFNGFLFKQYLQKTSTIVNDRTHKEAVHRNSNARNTMARGTHTQLLIGTVAAALMLTSCGGATSTPASTTTVARGDLIQS